MTQIFSGMKPMTPRDNSQSGSYFEQAVEALRSSGDPLTLWRAAPDFYRGSVIFEQPQRRMDAFQRRLWLLRSAVLFAAVCTEAYTNEFLAEVLTRSDAQAIDRLPTMDKLVLSPKIAGLKSPLRTGCEPLQTIRQLFKVRDALVHPRRNSPTAFVRYATERDEELVGPRAAGKYVVAVASLMELLDPLRPPPAVQFRPGRLIAKHPTTLEAHLAEIGATIGAVPEEDGASPAGLQVLASRREKNLSERRRGSEP